MVYIRKDYCPRRSTQIQVDVILVFHQFEYLRGGELNTQTYVTSDCVHTPGRLSRMLNNDDNFWAEQLGPIAYSLTDFHYIANVFCLSTLSASIDLNLSIKLLCSY